MKHKPQLLNLHACQQSRSACAASQTKGDRTSDYAIDSCGGYTLGAYAASISKSDNLPARMLLGHFESFGTTRKSKEVRK
jgi:hypothetical protein